MQATEELMSEFAGTPEAAELLKGARERVLKQRKAAADAIRQSEAARDAALPDAILTQQYAQQNVADCLESLKVAQKQLDEARSGVRGISARCAALVAPHERLLRETASPAIGKLYDELHDALGKQHTPERFAALLEVRDQLWREALSDDELADRIADIRQRAELGGDE